MLMRLFGYVFQGGNWNLIYRVSEKIIDWAVLFCKIYDLGENL